MIKYWQVFFPENLSGQKSNIKLNSYLVSSLRENDLKCPGIIFREDVSSDVRDVGE